MDRNAYGRNKLAKIELQMATISLLFVYLFLESC